MVESTLAGPAGQRVSNATLAKATRTGVVTVRAAGARAVHDDSYLVHGVGGIRLGSGHHRGNTPALSVALPPLPWAARWYTRLPPLQAAGHGTDEARWIADAGGPGLIVRESTTGLLQVRGQPRDLAAGLLSHTYRGRADFPLAQLLRIEVRATTAGLTVRAYREHEPTTAEEWEFPSLLLADTFGLTGYRYRSRRTLYLNDQGPEVRELQLDLITLGHNLGQWQADGHFGSLTLDAVKAVQREYGLVPVDGIPGSETRAAIDLALGRTPPPVWVSHLTVSVGTWIGPAQSPPAPSSSPLSIGLPI